MRLPCVSIRHIFLSLPRGAAETPRPAKLEGDCHASQHHCGCGRQQRAGAHSWSHLCGEPYGRHLHGQCHHQRDRYVWTGKRHLQQQPGHRQRSRSKAAVFHGQSRARRPRTKPASLRHLADQRFPADRRSVRKSPQQ